RDRHVFHSFNLELPVGGSPTHASSPVTKPVCTEGNIPQPLLRPEGSGPAITKKNAPDLTVGGVHGSGGGGALQRTALREVTRQPRWRWKRQTGRPDRLPATGRLLRRWRGALRRPSSP